MFDVDKQLRQHKSFQNPSTKHVSSRESSPPSSALVSPTRPLSPAAKAPKIYFAQLTPDDVDVYPSAPSSLKRKALALMPSPVGEEWVISLGEYKSHATNNQSDIVEGYHRTNPKHDILWFQVEAWDWGGDALGGIWLSGQADHVSMASEAARESVLSSFACCNRVSVREKSRSSCRGSGRCDEVMGSFLASTI